MYIIILILSIVLISYSVYFLYKAQIKISKHKISLSLSLALLLICFFGAKIIPINKNIDNNYTNINIITDDIIKVAIVNIKAPYVYYNSDGDLIGLEIDIINNLANKLNKNPIFIEIPLENLAESFTNNTIDIALGSLIANNPQNNKLIHDNNLIYTKAHLSTNLILYSNNKNIKSLQKIINYKSNNINYKNLSLGINNNYDSDYNNFVIFKNIKLLNKTYNDDEKTIKDVEKGITTFAIGDERVLKYHALMSENSNLVISNYKLPLATKKIAFIIKQDSILKPYLSE